MAQSAVPVAIQSRPVPRARRPDRRHRPLVPARPRGARRGDGGARPRRRGDGGLGGRRAGALHPLPRRRLAVPRPLAARSRCAPRSSCAPTCARSTATPTPAISVGIGAGSPAAGRRPRRRPSGPAFEVSGRGLDGWRAPSSSPSPGPSPPPGAAVVGAVFALCRRDLAALDPAPGRGADRDASRPATRSQEALAAQHGVSQQAIAKRLSGGGDWALRRALAAVEAAA